MDASTVTEQSPSDVEADPSVYSSGQPVRIKQKIIVAIHGIGSQLRSDTVRSVAKQFGERHDPPLPVMPLGYFDIAGVGEVDVRGLDLPPASHNMSPKQQQQRKLYSSLAFGEVYWADIPRQVVKDEDKLEESKAWGLSIVSRAESSYMESVRQRALEPADFKLAAGVVEEIVETVNVMQKLLTVADSAGLFKFDLAALLRDYVGDVQLVADFKHRREVILFRFHRVMQEIVSRVGARCGCDPEVYIVAHSEGTVISFLGILEALSRDSTCNPDDRNSHVETEWVKCLRGFMTIGSPIDKHILLWPKLWESFPTDCKKAGNGIVVARKGGGHSLTLTLPIKWRNYYDHGDPVGFSLETARAYLKQNHCEAAFEFEKSHDVGFSRYWLPGKAHTEYWADKDVFGHFIESVVLGNAAQKPQSRRWRGGVSTTIPYLISFVLHLAAVFMLYKALAPAPAQALLSQPPGFAYLPRSVFALSCLLMGATCAARLPRLVKSNNKWFTTTGMRWRVVALGSFLIAAGICWFVLPDKVAQSLAAPLGKLAGITVPQVGHAGKWAFVAAALVIASSGWRSARTPRRGRRVLIIIGAVVVGVIVVIRMLDVTDKPLWPVVMAGAFFLYAWWLAILVFDLAFVWHRYVRYSVALDTLRSWRQNGEDAKPVPIIRRRMAPQQAPPSSGS
ncbi:MFS transporter [Burkholderia sp. SRS-W-2-2016]|uniref:MFS transporter n=1 Tax=Burkholderia sp. SRS-W-2-2016 TaxID=1926878 RepID=UPI00094B1A28|nr:MFS transporter [Burkholderia sp. SRS-W-2-2016]OLL27226.1 MFS transporter [Burkholderia sp. SRS-W-2-2016]